MMDDLEIPHDGTELRPVRVSVPSWCCVRDCDKEATVLDYRAGAALHAGVLLIYALCPDHAGMEIP